ncbi:WecB/TagA/CpsF family glycosyltransferase [Tolypothrix sp. LEGE 11397]|uniref:WecB/TagA/CpsF family glycosyltransferase n=1 Tax=unclassified Tolypothrix TaxID=2649714 RepID=UPI0009DB6330|nr:WecB/TagA/CpsF family glycosyltransferase [Tolypothrix sp. LEGE 11397]UYD31032.1 WecB/TagA/CpsF family glycosyltransferase [Tolypothrix sp. PCC 7712]UYD38898.1 WecB/TagA/CpsF family glycosyltransferase [Tolypothrix sp. PCC 7601]
MLLIWASLQIKYLEKWHKNITPSISEPPTIKVLDFPITALTFEDQIQTLRKWMIARESRTVCIANVHMLMEAHGNSEFANVLKNADFVTPDGMPVVWMMRRMGAPSQDRVGGMDILQALCRLAQIQNVSVFFLGSQTEILARMRKSLEQEFPKLKIAAMEPLPFRPLTETEDADLINKINKSGAGLVFVSLGCPKQEHWMAQHKGKIQAVMIGVGGVFPVYAGIHKRAPRIIRELGFEWLYRWIQEPLRLWSRYLTTIPPFMWLATKQLLSSSRFNSVFFQETGE